MCLNVYNVKNSLQSSVASKDIVCYKILFKDLYGRYRTPYMYAYVLDDVINGIKPMCGEGDNMVCPCGKSRFSDEYLFNVSSGFVHTLSSFKDAKEEVNALLKYNKDDFIIFECIIPQGTVYYAGKDDWNNNSYASKEIVFKEIKF